MTISEEGGEPQAKEPAKAPAAPEPVAPTIPKKTKKGGFPLKLFLLAAAGGAFAVVKGMKK